MITVYVAERRGGWLKLSTDRDTLPPDAIRTETRVFPDYDSILETAELYWNRGFQVTVDTERGLVEYEH